MKFILIFVLIFATGEGTTGAKGFGTLAECEAQQKQLPELITRHNLTDPDKIARHASACVKVDESPKGRGV